jgi:hypothetical protein
MRLSIRLCFFCLLFVSEIVFASSADTSFHPNLKPNLDVKRRTGEIKIDGNLDDAGWQNVEVAGGFCNSFPVFGQKPKECTYGRITYDDDYLYVAMIAEDSTPQNIRATYAQRDRIWSEDFMGIILDTYGDGSRAFEIYANPYGVQGDLFWTTTNEDEAYDIIYESEGKITDKGWQLEMKIPFRSLRFPDLAVQNFNCTFWRSLPREQVYKSSWAAVNFYEPCGFCQFGKLTGIENIHPAGSYELLPSVVASQYANSFSGEPLVNEKVKFNPSLGIRYALGTATGLELALNPDFSQVESDAAQISANTTFALFYPEHRPFFQDGADLYSTNITAIYTRSINSPIVAAKALHRDEALSIAYTGAVDEHSPDIIPLEERSARILDAGKSVSNIARATYSFGNDSKIGGLLTNRTFTKDGSNTVAGLDGRIRLIENVEFSAEGMLSYTQEPTFIKNKDAGLFDNGLHTVEYDGEHFSGFGTHLSLFRYTSGLDIQLDYEATSPTFRAANGFIFRNDNQGFSSWTGHKFPLEGNSILKEFDMSFLVNYNRNFEGERKYVSFKPEIDLSLTGQTTLHIFYRHAMERFHDVDFANINYGQISGSTHPLSWMDISFGITYGRNIARYDTPSMGKSLDITINGAFKLLDGLIISPEFSFSRLDSIEGDGSYFSGAIYRTRFSYQFNRQINARVIVQYDEFSNAVEVDPLFTYQVNPFTSIYVGSSHHYNAFDNSNTLLPSERQFFAKIQYLFQG